MKYVGAAVRVSKKRYSAALILVEDGHVVQQVPLPAPTESGPKRLSELHDRTRDFVSQTKPNLFALKAFEGRAGKDEARRAEGAMIAGAASQGPLLIQVLVGAGMWKPAGFAQRTGADNASIVTALCKKLDTPLSGKEMRDAAAAAVAAILKSK